MSKRVRDNQDIYLAPKILSKVQDRVIDEKNENNILDPTNINDKITIYERQVKGWFLDRATKFLRGNDNGFIILMICMSYLEGVEQYKRGGSSDPRDTNNYRQNIDKPSKDTFISSVKKLYPDRYSDDNLKRLYSESRCGLFHNGMVGGNIIIRDRYPLAIKFDNDDILISPKKLLTAIKDDFKTYINSLRDSNNTELRNNFNRMFQIESE